MRRGGTLRNRLILAFLAATVVPLALTVWTSVELLERSLDLTPLRELDSLSQSFEHLGREYYQRSRDWLKADALAGRVPAQLYPNGDRPSWPPRLTEFWESGTEDRFDTSGEERQVLEYFRRTPAGVAVYSRELGVGMRSLTRDFARARGVISSTRDHDLRRGFVLAFVAVASAVWLSAFLGMIYFARRITAPVERLSKALSKLAAGDVSARVEGVARQDEIGRAIEAFNHMADQLQASREKLIHVTRLASWQALARKMAHEVKNSLTPIRLTMEEIAARSDGPDAEFLRQASQIVVDEVTSLEKRVRAFSDFAAEPPVSLEPLDLNGAVEERIAFLRAAHPEVIYNLHLAPGPPMAQADPDLVKAIVTNLLENAAEAARAGGVVLVRTAAASEEVSVEIHDSGPGLSLHARSTVFEPSISFKKGGMGLGLSIARKSALLCGGDIALIDGELGGAAFRVTLPAAPQSPGSLRPHAGSALA
jgi:two-component system nitrogen regulation sensor histidine kinase NtrY